MRDLELRLEPPDSPITSFCHISICGTRSLLSKSSLTLSEQTNGFWIIGALSDAVSVSVGPSKIVLGSGMVAAVNASISCELNTADKCTVLYALIHGTVADSLLVEAFAGCILFPTGGPLLSALLYPLFQSYQANETSKSLDACITAFALLAQLCQQGNAKPVASSRSSLAVQTAIQIMHEEFCTLYSIEDIADRLELSASHFIRIFSKTIGMTPGQYLTKLKIEYAKKLLSDKSLSVSTVADLSGFSSASYFGKVFRRLTGMTPSEYARLVPKSDVVETEDISAMYL